MKSKSEFSWQLCLFKLKKITVSSKTKVNSEETLHLNADMNMTFGIPVEEVQRTRKITKTHEMLRPSPQFLPFLSNALILDEACLSIAWGKLQSYGMWYFIWCGKTALDLHFKADTQQGTLLFKTSHTPPVQRRTPAQLSPLLCALSQSTFVRLRLRTNFQAHTWCKVRTAKCPDLFLQMQHVPKCRSYSSAFIAPSSAASSSLYRICQNPVLMIEEQKVMLPRCLFTSMA